MPLKPIVHGTPDPFEVPYYCKKCTYFQSMESGMPVCARTGKFFRPKIAFTCYVPKGAEKGIYDDNDTKSDDSNKE